MKQEDTKQKILDKALELFSEQGYDAVSVGQIAKAVGEGLTAALTACQYIDGKAKQ